MNGLRRATGERRVLVWSAEHREQADLALTPVAGLLSAATGPPTIGVFLNDGTGAKLGYYLHNTVALGAGRCRPDGRRELAVTMTLHYTAPSAGLPAHVKGIGVPGRPYALQTNVLVFAPAGGGLVGASRDGVAVGIMRGDGHGIAVGSQTVVLDPGAWTELKVRVLGRPPTDTAAQRIPALQLTPGVNPWTVAVEPYPPCPMPEQTADH